MSWCVGQTATHPLDVTKVRMQISNASFGASVRETFRTVGLRGFFVGWTAGALRQLTYSTARLGIYTSLYDICKGHFGTINFPTMIGIATVSGFVGSFIGTPTDLVLVRMIADMKLPPEKRWNYRNGFAGLIHIAKKDGVFSLWRGAVPTMIRGGVVNGTQLSTYSKAKVMLLDSGHFEEGVLLQFCASMISGLLTCLTSLPMDVAKTRIQNWTGPTKPPSLPATIINILQKEGVKSLWRGLVPYYARAAPNTVLTMISVEQLHHLYITIFLTPGD
ncbi:mitochondrial 2-oxoglutarate/malate carrier protein [Lasioglossum baleicum]|uniref:mitochondrial 2-oxoglutarate/malate carrier protein n=1 Tax=Lasioglossum baleicum TaxID=434251 RepID=UPI003FCD87FC